MYCSFSNLTIVRLFWVVFWQYCLIKSNEIRGVEKRCSLATSLESVKVISYKQSSHTIEGIFMNVVLQMTFEHPHIIFVKFFITCKDCKGIFYKNCFLFYIFFKLFLIKSGQRATFLYPLNIISFYQTLLSSICIRIQKNLTVDLGL